MHLKYVGSDQSWYYADLCRASAGRHEISALPYEEIASGVGINGSDLDEDCLACDAAILRSMPPGSLEQVVYRMDALGQSEQAGVYLLNPPKAMETAIDKYLCTARLAAAGLMTPPTHVSQDWKQALQAFGAMGRDVVVKPLFGGEGRGITRITDEELAERAFKMLSQMGAVIYQQQYIDHQGYDLRVFLLGQKMWGMRRTSHVDWRTNVSRGAATEPLELTSEISQLARRAADAVGAVLAGVDILDGQDGNRYVLEVNAVPGWKALSKTLQVDVAAEILAHIETAVDG